MRITVFVRLASLFAAVAFPVLAAAQFQQPTPEELKMTSDPKAPGAAAVYLNIEEVADDNTRDWSYYYRIKILTEQGRDLAKVTIRYPGYFRVISLQGRTIHPDGTVIPLTTKPEDQPAAQNDEDSPGQKTFTLPDAEVGSILEYRYQLDYDRSKEIRIEHHSAPLWEIQRPYYVHKAHYMFVPFRSFLKSGLDVNPIPTHHYVYDIRTGQRLDFIAWWTLLPPGTPPVVSDAQGRFILDVADIPPIPKEEWAPPVQSLLYKVFFYYKGAYSTDQFWSEVATDWSKSVDRLAAPSNAMRAAVGGIVAPGDNDLVKAQKLYRAVQALDNTDYSREAGDSGHRQEARPQAARRAEETWARKSGNSEDIAMLYLAMLRAAGVQSYAMKVVNRERAVFDPAYMFAEQLTDTVVLLPVDGKEIALDPGEKMCPFQTLSWHHTGVTGMRQGPNGAGFSQTPPQRFTENSIVRTADITLDARGGASGDLNIVMAGQSALSWRQFALRHDEAKLKQSFDRYLEGIVPSGVTAHVDHFLGMDDPAKNLLAVANFKGLVGMATDQLLSVPGSFFESRGAMPFVNEEKRELPVDMHYAARVTDQATYNLPAGMNVETAPPDANIPWPQHALYTVKTESAPDHILITRVLARGFDRAKPEEYPELRGFYLKVASSDRQQLVLRTAAAGAGN